MQAFCAAASSSRASEQRNFWSLNGYYFQGLAAFYDQDTIPVALPLGETRFVSDRYCGGSYFTADANMLALTRNKGLDTRRLSNRVGWTLPYVGPIGDVYTLDVSMRGDIYNTDGDPQHVHLRRRQRHAGPRPAALHGTGAGRSPTGPAPGCTRSSPWSA